MSNINEQLLSDLGATFLAPRLGRTRLHLRLSHASNVNIGEPTIHITSLWSSNKPSKATMAASSRDDETARPSILDAGGMPSSFESDGTASPGHITIEPPRPLLFKRNTVRGESTKSISEALRLARSREEQETLLGEGEEADDDGCYPPRKDDNPRAPNPHSQLPVYTTIHRIRRLVIAAIGTLSWFRVYRAALTRSS